jgi:hypothetical protein
VAPVEPSSVRVPVLASVWLSFCASMNWHSGSVGENVAVVLEVMSSVTVQLPVTTTVLATSPEMSRSVDVPAVITGVTV